VKPYGLLIDKQTGQNTAFPLTAGWDVKLGLLKLALESYGTQIFSATDVDQEQFNLTPFPISSGERQFFLENAGIFDSTWGTMTSCLQTGRSESIGNGISAFNGGAN